MSNKLSHIEFVARSTAIHGNKYDYNDHYKTMATKIKITCKKHGDFEQLPNNHLRGQGCPVCGGSQQKTTKQFIEKAQSIHNDVYDYSKVMYTNGRSSITIICKQHGPFDQIANDHIKGCGCSKCSGKYNYNTAEFIEKAKTIHQDLYDYTVVNYVNWKTNIVINCKKHGEFNQTPHNHLRGHGCPNCAILKSKNYSRKCIDWLTHIEGKNGIKIQHAENDGEFAIPLTKFRVDGYHEKSNTIYEFYGDAFHGNPKVFNASIYCHPYDKKISAGVLLDHTLERERQLKLLGYNIVAMWEKDWDLFKGKL